MNRPAWLPKYIWHPVTWVAHWAIQRGLRLFGVWAAGPAFAALLCGISMPFWIEREKRQKGLKSLDDWLDLLGPAIETVLAFWVLFR
jgi:hypothetical protein